MAVSANNSWVDSYLEALVSDSLCWAEHAAYSWLHMHSHEPCWCHYGILYSERSKQGAQHSSQG